MRVPIMRVDEMVGRGAEADRSVAQLSAVPLPRGASVSGESPDRRYMLVIRNANGSLPLGIT